jgi:hypothetical protein
MEYTKTEFEDKLQEKLIAEKKIVAHPIMADIQAFYGFLLDAETRKEILQVTSDIDDYLNKGINWKIDVLRDPEVPAILNQFYDLAMVKRREAVPTYSSMSLHKYIGIVRSHVNGFSAKESEKPGMKALHKTFCDILDHLNHIKEVIDHPEIVGLHEKSQFDTVEKEVGSALNIIYEISTREKLFPETWFPFIVEEQTQCLEERSFLKRNLEPFQEYLDSEESCGLRM